MKKFIPGSSNISCQIPSVAPSCSRCSCQQPPVGRSTDPNAPWPWLPSGREAPRGHRSLGQETGTSAARARGAGRSASEGALPHLLISALPGAPGSEQQSHPGPHFLCLCHTPVFMTATQWDLSQRGCASFCARPCALPAAAAPAAMGAPCAALSRQRRGASAHCLSSS